LTIFEIDGFLWIFPGEAHMVSLQPSTPLGKSPFSTHPHQPIVLAPRRRGYWEIYQQEMGIDMEKLEKYTH
jgi:hypothetical protein